MLIKFVDGLFNFIFNWTTNKHFWCFFVEMLVDNIMIGIFDLQRLSTVMIIIMADNWFSLISYRTMILFSTVYIILILFLSIIIVSLIIIVLRIIGYSFHSTKVTFIIYTVNIDIQLRMKIIILKERPFIIYVNRLWSFYQIVILFRNWIIIIIIYRLFWMNILIGMTNKIITLNRLAIVFIFKWLFILIIVIRRLYCLMIVIHWIFHILFVIIIFFLALYFTFNCFLIPKPIFLSYFL